MKTGISFALLVLSSVLPAGARIGESREQLIARYGTPIPQEKEDPSSLAFQKSGLTVLATLLNGTCQSLTVLNRKDPDGKHADFTTDEVKALLQANGMGALWDADDRIHNGCILYKTTDGRVSATLIGGRTLLIQTTAYKAVQDAKTAAKVTDDLTKDAGLEGF